MCPNALWRSERHGDRIRSHQRSTRNGARVTQVKDLPHVTDATVLFGDHDLIVKLEADDLATIAKAVVEHIRSVEGVVNTKPPPVRTWTDETVSTAKQGWKNRVRMGY